MNAEGSLNGDYANLLLLFGDLLNSLFSNFLFSSHGIDLLSYKKFLPWMYNSTLKDRCKNVF
jgi:hypothetical protein